MSQYARPDSDTSLGGWSNPTWSVIDEPVASYDGTYSLSPNKSDGTYVGTLSNITDPQVATGHVLRIRGYIQATGFSYFYVHLYCGATLIKTWEPGFTGSAATYTYTLSESEANAITDYSNLILHLQFDYSSGSQGRAYVDCFEFETPDAGTTYNLTATDITSGVAVLGTPTIAQTHVLTAADITSGVAVLEAPTLTSGQTHNLTASDIVTEPAELEAPTISQTHVLTAADITSGIAVLDAPTLTSQSPPTVLDDFNRANGQLGSNWYTNNPASWEVYNQQARYLGSSYGWAAWNVEKFGTYQEVSVKVISIDTSSSLEYDLILKVQSLAGTPPMIEVYHDPTSSVVEVWVYTGITWLKAGDTATGISFSNGDIFRATADENGDVVVYKNQNIILEANVASIWSSYYNLDGYIGVYMHDTGSSPYNTWDDFDGGTVSAGDDLTAEDIITDPAILGSPTIAQTHNLSSEDIVTPAAELEAPTITSGQTYELTADDITTEPVIFETPSIGQIHVLSSNDIITEPVVFEIPTIGQTHVLSSNDITTEAAELEAPSLEAIDQLIAEDIVTEPVIFETPSIGQTHVLTANDIVTEAAELGAPSLEAIDQLIAEDITAEPTVLGSPYCDIYGELLDDFNRANESDISNNNGWGGRVFWGPNAGFSIVDQELAQTDFMPSQNLWGTQFSKNQEIYITLKNVVDGFLHLYLRVTQQDTIYANGYTLKCDFDNDKISIWRMDNTSSSIKLVEDDFTFTSGDRIKFVSVGIVHTAYIDSGSGWTQLLQAVDAKYYLSSYIGLYGYTSSIFDDFSGGERPDTPVYNLTTNNITSGAAVLENPTIGQIHNLTSNDILTESAFLESPSLETTDALIADDIVTDPSVLDAPTIGQTHILVSNDITTDPAILDAPVLSEILPDELVAEDITTLPVFIGVPNLGQTHILLGSNIETENSYLESPTLIEINALISEDIITEAVIFDQPLFGQNHLLLSEDIESLAVLFGTPNLYIRLTPTDPDRIYKLEYEDRVVLVELESRTVDIPLEVRKIADK